MSWEQVFFILGLAAAAVVLSRHASAAVKHWLGLAGALLLAAAVLRHGPEAVALLKHIADTVWPVLAKAAARGAEAFAQFMHSVLH
ncbi:hypothetical protein [Desulfovirgula thermocuniculi]|uniref:hypothetical protein n=1 Tax=Desulfovirgula thermocuniculi TaxID=348842 RepID=UPI0004228030|nr:hypothetical protein [Desulfovirgula thermocuniculi]